MQSQTRDALNLSRKIQHAASGILFALACVQYYAVFYKVLTALTFTTLLVEILRRIEEFGWINEIISLICGSTLRKHEMVREKDTGMITNMTGSFYFFLGSWLTMTIFPCVPATIGILHLGIADPAASYFGYHTKNIYWSRIRGKGIFGVFGGALVCVPFTYVMFEYTNWAFINSFSEQLRLSIILGLTASFVDFIVPSPTITIFSGMKLNVRGVAIHLPAIHMDDNVIIPLATASMCSLLLRTIEFKDEFN